MFERTVLDGVTLRPLETWHAEDFAAHLDRAREHIRPWVGPAFVTDTVAGARATLQRYADATAHDGARIYGLWEDGTLLGGVMFTTFDAAWGTCEIGCWLEPAAEGRGLVSAAVRVLVDWAFTARSMERVEWRCRTDNTRSIAVARRLGMQSDGVLRSSWVFAGQRYDKEVFSVLRQEWSQRL
ncbi:GNAT family protein [Curtobacterium sp. ISL-83]|uniref:GNAT family N-acetyltransferase n=1 Tax=Curtobacterium sp. ISL-83 TaxID=2819145 RepID=UPI001C1D2896|nr:GNAT family protein [Curtobacterium sp. ISL-83]MBT2501254.1 GNAT family N-acetyltransferase [Curtobacterium sp. ISL-83]